MNGTPQLADYVPVVGEEAIDELRAIAAPLQGFEVQHVNSTRVGGGVAEILARMVPLTQELGLQCNWDVIRGDSAFFGVTKSFHNALQGERVALDDVDFETYNRVNRENAEVLALTGDLVIVHDPQPAALISYAKRTRPKGLCFWRCHIDASQPDPVVWKFLERFVRRYNGMIISAPQFGQKTAVPQYLVSPSIDPLSDKNRDLAPEVVRSVLERLQIDPLRPIVTQISRFDRFKDPIGVIQAWKLVRQGIDCQLVLAGGGATDDPEGLEVLAEVMDAAAGERDIHVIDLPPHSDIEVNALQRASRVIVQKSIREGFGLTVSEALWKRRPVVAGSVGGIPLQVIDWHDGFLVNSIEGAAYRIRYLLANPAEADRMGENGRRHVLRNFLLTRHLRNYLLVFHAALRRSEPEIQLRAVVPAAIVDPCRVSPDPGPPASTGSRGAAAADAASQAPFPRSAGGA